MEEWSVKRMGELTLFRRLVSVRVMYFAFSFWAHPLVFSAMNDFLRASETDKNFVIVELKTNVYTHNLILSSNLFCHCLALTEIKSNDLDIKTNKLTKGQ